MARRRQNLEDQPPGADFGALLQVGDERGGRRKDRFVGLEGIARREAPVGVRGGDMDRSRSRGEQRGQRGDVVEVPVREQHGGELRPRVPQRREDPRGVLPGVDGRRLPGPVEHQIGVLLIRPRHDALDVHASGF